MKDEQRFERVIEYQFYSTPATITALAFSIMFFIFSLWNNQPGFSITWAVIICSVFVLNYFSFREVYWRKIKN